MSDFPAESTAERTVIQAALDRGYLTPTQLGDAIQVRDARRAQGQRATLLQVAQEQFFPTERVPELVALYRQAGSGPATVTVANSGQAEGFSEQDTVATPVQQRAQRRNPNRSDSGSTPRAAPSGVTARPTPHELGQKAPRSRERSYGRYRVLDELGRGGMGTVFRAHDPSLGREVALKVLQLDMGGPAELERFRREAHAAGSLSHPYLVPVFDFGVEGDSPWMVMELVPGESLASRLKRQGAFEPREAAGIVAKVARGLAAAHEQGVLHRDLKPGNVLLAPDGTPRLTDFGLARRVQGGASLTESGQVLGTPSYMAPEQALGELKRFGPPTDVYGLGATFYHLLVGEPPYVGSGALKILAKLLSGPPMPPAQRVDLPKGLDRICMRCLAHDPEERFASAGELADALDRWLQRRDAPPRSRPPAPAPRALSGLSLVSAGMGGLAVVVLGGAVIAQRFGGEATPVAETPADPPPPPSVGSPAEQAQALLREARSDPARAGELVARARELAPDEPAVLHAVAQVALAAKNLEGAAQAIEQALARAPGDGVALSLRAELLARQQRLGDALRAIWEAREAGPGAREPQLNQLEVELLWTVLERLRGAQPPDFARIAEVAGRLLKLGVGEREREVRKLHAHALLQQGKLVAARRELLRARDAGPGADGGLECALADVLFELGEYPECLAAAERAAELTQSDLDSRTYYRAQVFKGRSLLHLGDANGAIKALQEAVRVDPQRWEAYRAQGRVYNGLQDWRRALVCTQEAAKHGAPPSQLYSVQITARAKLEDWEDVRTLCRAWLSEGVPHNREDGVRQLLEKAERLLAEPR